MSYQLESSHVANYEMYRLPGIEYPLRGPYWPLDGDVPVISFLGAAQTFGAFCNHPFPNLLGEMCSAQVLNLARGGAGPGFYCGQEAVLEHVNRSKLCIVQVMSARSSAQNHLMSSPEGLASVEFIKGPHKGKRMLGHHAFQLLSSELDQASFHDLIRETVGNYLGQYATLAKMIRVPKVLLHVGRSDPPAALAPDAAPEDLKRLIDTHPHMITAADLRTLADHFDQTVTVTGPEGFDARLVDRIKGRYCSIPRSETYTVARHNAYLSPYLHARTAVELFGVANGIINGRRSAREAAKKPA